MGSTVIVLDFETTGMSPNVGARPTEVAAVRIENGRIVDRYQSLMNGGVYVPAFITELTGITNTMVRNAPPIDQVMRELHAFVDGQPLVAHNVSFDRKFLEAEWQRLRLPMTSPLLCSLLVSRRLYPHLASHKLGALVEHLNIPRTGRYHRALADTEMTAHLWLRMMTDLADQLDCSTVPLALMQQLQSVAKPRVGEFLRSYRDHQSQTISAIA